MINNTNKTAKDGQNGQMGSARVQGEFLWPPENLPGFSAVPTTSGSALRRNPRDSQLYGLSYAIGPEASGIRENESGMYRLQIDAWIYGVQNETMSMPVMHFSFASCDPGAGGAAVAVHGLKVLARSIDDDGFAGARALSVALFFINQINAGQVPEYERILKLHKLHPQEDTDLNTDNKTATPPYTGDRGA